MRIAYLINQYPKVSHSFIRREIMALERSGFEILRIALRGWDAELIDPGDLVERERTRYVLRAGAPPLLLALVRMMLLRPIRFLRALATTWHMSHCAERSFLVHFIYLAEACQVERWLQTAGVKHVHAHFGTNSADVAMLVHILGGPRWSFTVHGPEEFDKWQLIGLAQKVRDCAFVVAVSSYGRSQLYRFLDHEQWPKVQVVHCGLESAFYTVRTSVVPEAQRLICVGRLCGQKGQLLLVEATQRLVARGVNVEVVLAGDGEMRSEIEALVARFELQKNVRFTGWISGEQVRAEILAARALVLPSFAEGLPVVIMEAMALKRPVISTYIGGIPELVRPGEHGWLVPAGDVDALVQAMQECLDAPVSAISRMGEAAHKVVLARHCVEIEATKLGNLFRAAKTLNY